MSAYQVSEIRTWDPHVLSDAARALREANSKFSTALSDMKIAAESAEDTWTGQGATAAKNRALKEWRMGTRIHDRVEELAAAFVSGANGLSSVKDHAIGCVDAALADGFSVSDESWSVKNDRGTEKEKEARAGNLASHVSAVAGSRKQLIAEDVAVGNKIDAASDEVVATGDDAAAGRDYVPPRVTSKEAADKLINDPHFKQWAKDHPDAAKALLDNLVDSGKLAANSEFYKNFLQNFYQREALEAAGIDPSKWDPSKGPEYNRDIITKVYEYYGKLYLDHPELQWAGMANMIGPSFAGGFFDIAMLRKIAAGVTAGSVVPGFPGGVLTGSAAALSDFELMRFQEEFLTMQKEIFYDQAMMHEAYLRGGSKEIDRLAAAGLLNPNTKTAWHNIELGQQTGNMELIKQGNASLLYREQHDIISDNYERMYSRPGSGPIFTQLLTAVGAPSIPGAHTFGEVFPKTIHMPTSPLQPESIFGYDNPLNLKLWFQTAFPDGNIADFNDRWKLITGDTLPAYQRVLEDPDFARSIIGSDFSHRLEEQRLSHQVGNILARLAAGVHFKGVTQ